MRRFYPPTESNIPMHGWVPYSDVHRERIRAHAKHDDNGDSMERKSWNEFDMWLSVLVEEVGEIAKVLCDHRHHGTYGSYREMSPELRKELVQVAAMAVAWIEAIDEERCGHAIPDSLFHDKKIDTCAKQPHDDGPHVGWSGVVHLERVTRKLELE